jgi:hypothetical protein
MNFKSPAQTLEPLPAGALAYNEVLRLASESEKRLQELMENSPLPPAPDVDRANALFVKMQERYLFSSPMPAR